MRSHRQTSKEGSLDNVHEVPERVPGVGLKADSVQNLPPRHGILELSVFTAGQQLEGSLEKEMNGLGEPPRRRHLLDLLQRRQASLRWPRSRPDPLPLAFSDQPESLLNVLEQNHENGDDSGRQDPVEEEPRNGESVWC
jgi:hypothetical protein